MCLHPGGIGLMLRKRQELQKADGKDGKAQPLTHVQFHFNTIFASRQPQLQLHCHVCVFIETHFDKYPVSTAVILFYRTKNSTIDEQRISPRQFVSPSPCLKQIERLSDMLPRPHLQAILRFHMTHSMREGGSVFVQ